MASSSPPHGAALQALRSMGSPRRSSMSPLGRQSSQRSLVGMLQAVGRQSSQRSLVGILEAGGIGRRDSAQLVDEDVTRVTSLARQLAEEHRKEQAMQARESKVRARDMKAQLATGGKLTAMASSPGSQAVQALLSLAPAARRVEPARASTSVAVDDKREALWAEVELMRAADEERIEAAKARGAAKQDALAALVESAAREAEEASRAAAQAVREAAEREARAEAARKLWSEPRRGSQQGILDQIRARLGSSSASSHAMQVLSPSGPSTTYRLPSLTSPGLFTRQGSALLLQGSTTTAGHGRLLSPNGGHSSSPERNGVGVMGSPIRHIGFVAPPLSLQSPGKGKVHWQDAASGAQTVPEGAAQVRSPPHISAIRRTGSFRSSLTSINGSHVEGPRSPPAQAAAIVKGEGTRRPSFSLKGLEHGPIAMAMAGVGQRPPAGLPVAMPDVSVSKLQERSGRRASIAASPESTARSAQGSQARLPPTSAAAAAADNYNGIVWSTTFTDTLTDTMLAAGISASDAYMVGAQREGGSSRRPSVDASVGREGGYSTSSCASSVSILSQPRSTVGDRSIKSHTATGKQGGQHSAGSPVYRVSGGEKVFSLKGLEHGPIAMAMAGVGRRPPAGLPLAIPDASISQIHESSGMRVVKRMGQGAHGGGVAGILSPSRQNKRGVGPALRRS